MTSIEISVVGAVAQSTVNGKITSGMIGIPVTLSFDSAWAELQKTVVFRAGKFSRDRRNIESSTTVPKEITRLPFRALEIGVEGRSEDGSLVIPTVWTTVTTILPGANATIPASTDPNDTPQTGGADPLYLHQIHFGDPDDVILFSQEGYEGSPHLYIEIYNRNPNQMEISEIVEGGHFKYASCPPFWIADWDTIDGTYQVLRLNADENESKLYIDLWNPQSPGDGSNFTATYNFNDFYVYDTVTKI